MKTGTRVGQAPRGIAERRVHLRPQAATAAGDTGRVSSPGRGRSAVPLAGVPRAVDRLRLPPGDGRGEPHPRPLPAAVGGLNRG